MPTWRLVVSDQNHDQVGNRARGDRLSDLSPGHLDDDQLACAALLTICGPFTPMLFMGEEWAASTPFQFFTSHPEADLGRATAEGRIAEFAKMGWDPAEVPDPQDPATFARSKLDWSEVEVGRHARLLATYRHLIQLRQDEPELNDPAFAALAAHADEETRVFTLRRGSLLIAVNFSGVAASVSAYGDLLFTTPTAATVTDGLHLPPHTGALLRTDPRA
jgi:maltooligosyltrehalose trehalohydrolase